MSRSGCWDSAAKQAEDPRPAVRIPRQDSSPRKTGFPRTGSPESERAWRRVHSWGRGIGALARSHESPGHNGEHMSSLPLPQRMRIGIKIQYLRRSATKCRRQWIRVADQTALCGLLNRLQHGRRGGVGILVGIQLDELADLRLFAGRSPTSLDFGTKITPPSRVPPP
jgi:hypothetical protein